MFSICTLPSPASVRCSCAQLPRGRSYVRASPLNFASVYRFLYNGSAARITAGASVSCARSTIGGSSVRPNAFNPSRTPGMIVCVNHCVSSGPTPCMASPRQTINPTFGYFSTKAAIDLRV